MCGNFLENKVQVGVMCQEVSFIMRSYFYSAGKTGKYLLHWFLSMIKKGNLTPLVEEN